MYITNVLLNLLVLMRLKQWVKNSFVLIPLIFAGSFLELKSITHSLLAALLFCLASSAIYIINDIHDIEQDRCHPRKLKTRPLASGMISVSSALILLIVLFSILVTAWFIMSSVVYVIAAYIILNLAYTFILKHQPIVDIFSIAFGFVLRVYAGAIAIEVPISSWMFITTLCLALYLAAIKRRQEIIQHGSAARTVLKKYSISLIERYAEISATGALIFYSMFVMSAKPQLIVTIPIVLFGLFRYWWVVEMLEEGESPTDVLLTDWQLLLTVGLWAGLCGWILVPIQE